MLIETLFGKKRQVLDFTTVPNSDSMDCRAKNISFVEIYDILVILPRSLNHSRY